MINKKYPPTRNLRDIGQVILFGEKMDAARESSSCCVGVEAALETSKGIDGVKHRLLNPITPRKYDPR
jgi:hypothetical protein